MKLNKLLLILLIIIIVCCVLVGAVLLTIDNDSEEVNNTSSINNTTVATEVNSSTEPVESSEDYDPYGYGNAKKQEYLSSLTNPLVIHYIMADKPWKCGSVVFRRRDYIAAFKNTPWFLKHKSKCFLQCFMRGPALLVEFLKYWYKHPICWFKPKFWRKVKQIIFPLAFLR